MSGPGRPLDADGARSWALLARAAFAARRSEVDALNVFPVPDGDTGTNLYLTMDSALDDVARGHVASGVLGGASLAQECRSLSRALLLAARGNSGVILSQLLGGVCLAIADAGVDEVDAALLALAVRRGADLARASVAAPQEGTILSVADAAADAAERAAADGADLVGVATALVNASRSALARTPEQLSVLAQAGVVDAGGAGAVLLVEALLRVLTGDWTPDLGYAVGGGDPLHRRTEWHPVPTPTPSGPSAVDPGSGVLSPAYEVMFLLDATDEPSVDRLKETLGGLGDSLLVVGGPDLWNIHVHVDDPGAAVEAGIVAGRPHRVRITHFASQAEARHAPLGGSPARVGVVACAAGPGIAALLEDAGARVVESGPARRASAGQLLEAVLACATAEVLLLPNDKDTVLAAETARQAAGEQGVTVAVVPARTAVQGLAALAVHEPERGLQDNVIAMSSAAAATRHGAVTVAAKEALTWAGACQPGDILGVVDGDFVLIGTDMAAVALEVLARLLAAGGELVTVVTGADHDPLVVEEIERSLRHDRPEVDLVILDGGQPLYPLLLGVE